MCIRDRINEGLSTHASRAVSPGHAAWEYYGYTRREYASVRELEPIMTRALGNDLDRAGLGLRLRYLSGGMSDDARTVDRHVFPERSGYFLGTKMVEPARAHRGLDHFRAEEITTPLREDVPIDGACVVAHSTREVPEAQAEPGAIEIIPQGACHYRLELSDARILTACVSV